MAFYTARVDELGNEIEQRQLPMPNFMNFNFESDESSTCDTLSLAERMTIDEEEEDGAVEQDVGDIVPLLDIQSVCNYSTQAPFTYKLPRKYETAKIVLEPNKAYEDWLAKKRQRALDEAARRKREIEEKRQREEERKRLAEEKYEKWLEKKQSAKTSRSERSALRSAPKVKMAAPETQPPAQSIVPMTAPTISTMRLNQLSAEREAEKQRKLAEWDRKKRKQEIERRLRAQKAEEQRAIEEAERKQRNNGAHEKWLERNKHAPKPVPLNQGLMTLRGTVSKIYVNPNEWRTD